LDDLITGNNGDDSVFGNGGDDDLHGDAGNDLIEGGLGNDALFGVAGDDTYAFFDDFGLDTITEVAGLANTLDFSGAGNDLAITLDTNLIDVTDGINSVIT